VQNKPRKAPAPALFDVRDGGLALTAAELTNPLARQPFFYGAKIMSALRPSKSRFLTFCYDEQKKAMPSKPLFFIEQKQKQASRGRLAC